MKYVVTLLLLCAFLSASDNIKKKSTNESIVDNYCSDNGTGITVNNIWYVCTGNKYMTEEEILEKAIDEINKLYKELKMKDELIAEFMSLTKEINFKTADPKVRDIINKHLNTIITIYDNYGIK